MGRIALLFPGQGAQTVGMGFALVEKYPIARSLFDRANVVVGYDLAKFCFMAPEKQNLAHDRSIRQIGRAVV